MFVIGLPNVPSLCIREHIPLFLDRFAISFAIDGPQIEYCIRERRSGRDVSCAIEIGLDRGQKHIDVLMFYPGLNQLPETRYFSAVCFFLVIHHFSHHFHLSADYSIFLRTKLEIYNRFYGTFTDFHFSIAQPSEDLLVVASCRFQPMDVDVAMILERSGLPSSVSH